MDYNVKNCYFVILKTFSDLLDILYLEKYNKLYVIY